MNHHQQAVELDARTRRIQEFFDEDSARYVDERYPSEPRTCDQFSYLIRRTYVLDMLDRIGHGGRLLDIGCGPGVLAPDLVQRQWTVHAVDLSTGMLAKARQSTATASGTSIRFAAANATNLPFKAESFDAVLCIGVVSYVNDLAALLRGVRRVLRHGGQAIFQISNALGLFEVEGRLLERIRQWVPSRPGDSHDRFRSEVRLRPYRPSQFDHWCAEAGLERREFRFYDFRPPMVINRILPRLSLRVGRALESLGHSSLSAGLAANYLVRVSRIEADRQ